MEERTARLDEVSSQASRSSDAMSSVRRSPGIACGSADIDTYAYQPPVKRIIDVRITTRLTRLIVSHKRYRLRRY